MFHEWGTPGYCRLPRGSQRANPAVSLKSDASSDEPACSCKKRWFALTYSCWKQVVISTKSNNFFCWSNSPAKLSWWCGHQMRRCMSKRALKMTMWSLRWILMKMVAWIWGWWGTRAMWGVDLETSTTWVASTTLLTLSFFGLRSSSVLPSPASRMSYFFLKSVGEPV